MAAAVLPASGTVPASCVVCILPLSMLRLSHLQAKALPLAISCQLKQQCMWSAAGGDLRQGCACCACAPAHHQQTLQHACCVSTTLVSICLLSPNSTLSRDGRGAAPCIIPVCTAEQWPQLDMHALLQQHQADVTTEQHHSEVVCQQQPSRHVQQASQLCQVQCTIQSLLPA